MQRVVIAPEHQGYGLSTAALDALRERGHADPEALPRDHPDLVAVIDALGDRAGDSAAWWPGPTRLVVVAIPDGVDWVIEEYDGAEHVAERHRRWDYLGEVPPGGKPRYVDG